jgi:hypothetical protein
VAERQPQGLIEVKIQVAISSGVEIVILKEDKISIEAEIQEIFVNFFIISIISEGTIDSSKTSDK